MNTHALLLGIGAGLLLTAGTASAGTCSAEIEALQKAIQSAGSVALANQAPGTSIQQGANAAIAANSPRPLTLAPAPDVNGTGGMMANQGAGGQPAETAPLDSDTPEAAQPGTAANPVDPDAASQSLARAKVLDQAGDEAGCMSQVNQAKSQLGRQ